MGNYTTMGACPRTDYLEISDGSSSQRYCGTSTPAPLTTTNTITVKLHLEDDGVRSKFLATACCSVAVTTDVNTGEWRLKYRFWTIDCIYHYQAPPPRVSSSLLLMDSIETRIVGR